MIGDPEPTPIDRAEAWIKTAGLHYDRESEVAEHLFGERGSLRRLKLEEPERNRLLALWRGQRPTSERLEREADERAQSWRAAKAREEKIVRLDDVLRKRMKEKRDGR